jgi:hypothetical protein
MHKCKRKAPVHHETSLATKGWFSSSPKRPQTQKHPQKKRKKEAFHQQKQQQQLIIISE